MARLWRLVGELLIAAGLYLGVDAGVNFARTLNYEGTGNNAARQVLGKDTLETLVDAPPGSGDEKPGIYIIIEGPPGIDSRDVEVQIEEIRQPMINTQLQRSDYVRRDMINTGMGLFMIAYGGFLIYLNRPRSTNSEEPSHTQQNTPQQ